MLTVLLKLLITCLNLLHWLYSMIIFEPHSSLCCLPFCNGTQQAMFSSSSFKPDERNMKTATITGELHYSLSYQCCLSTCCPCVFKAICYSTRNLSSLGKLTTDCTLDSHTDGASMWITTKDICSLYWSRKDTWLSASWDTLGTTETPWAFCKDH